MICSAISVKAGVQKCHAWSCVVQPCNILVHSLKSDTLNQIPSTELLNCDLTELERKALLAIVNQSDL